MAKRIPYFWSLVMGGLLLAGCAATSFSGEDPHFPGFHSNHSSDGVTAIIVDRSQLAADRKRPNLPPAQPDGDQPENYWAYENRFQRDFSSSYNLVYHLYGPDHYRPYGQRYWLGYQRQWGQLPWYGSDPYYDSWWYDPYWSWEYRWNSWAWDPWFDHFYDPYYWDPYGGYGYGYGNNYGYYYRYPNSQYWYYQRGTLATGSDDGRKQRRSRNRRGWPDTQGGQMTNNPLASSISKASSESTGASPTQQRGSARKAGGESGSKARAKSANSSSGNSGQKQTRKRNRKK